MTVKDFIKILKRFPKDFDVVGEDHAGNTNPLYLNVRVDYDTKRLTIGFYKEEKS